jgi:catechol 2,3-dioxygenase-like lactoylglutathione lyase family enzyme
VIERIDNVGVAVTSLERALAFYRQLGFQVEEREEETPSATVAAGGARLWLFQTRSRAVVSRHLSMTDNPPGLDHVSFWVEDVDAVAERLKAGGLALESGPADQPWGARAASLLDPDGNRIYLLGRLRGG